MIPRKYFSGGVTMEDMGWRVQQQLVSGRDAAQLAAGKMKSSKMFVLTVGLIAGIGVVTSQKASAAIFSGEGTTPVAIVHQRDTVSRIVLGSPAAKRIEQSLGKKLSRSDYRYLEHSGAITLKNAHGNIEINLDSIKAKSSVDSAMTASVALTAGQEEIARSQFERQTDDERIKEFNDLLASIVNGETSLSDPHVENSLVDRVLWLYELGEGKLIGERIDAYQQLLQQRKPFRNDASLSHHLPWKKN